MTKGAKLAKECLPPRPLDSIVVHTLIHREINKLLGELIEDFTRIRNEVNEIDELTIAPKEVANAERV